MKHKQVRDGVYETGKMHVRIDEATVRKTFKQSRKAEARFSCERRALERLLGSEGFPQLLSFDEQSLTVEMTRLPGGTPTSLGEDELVQLRGLVDQLLARGVARHAMPLRDLLVSSSGRLGMTDFERVSLRSLEASPVWQIAKIVTRYHVYRLIGEFHPQGLSRAEKILLTTINGIRSVGQPLRALKNRARSRLR